MNTGIKAFWNVGVICLVAVCCLGDVFGGYSEELNQGAHDYNTAISIANSADSNNLHSARNSYAQAIDYLNYSINHYNRAKDLSKDDMLHGQICNQVDNRVGQIVGVRNQLQGYINTIDENLRVIAENERRRREADAANNYGNVANALIGELNAKNPGDDLRGYLAHIDNIINHLEASANHWRAYPHDENANFQSNQAQQFRHHRDAVYNEQTASTMWNEAQSNYSEDRHDAYVKTMQEIAVYFSLAAQAYDGAGDEKAKANAIRSQNFASASHYTRTGEKKVRELKEISTEDFDPYLDHVYEIMAHFNAAMYHWSEAGEEKQRALCEQKSSQYRQKLNQMLQTREEQIRALDEVIKIAQESRLKNYAKLASLYESNAVYWYQIARIQGKLGDLPKHYLSAGLEHECRAAAFAYQILLDSAFWGAFKPFMSQEFFEGLIHGNHSQGARDEFIGAFNQAADQVRDLADMANAYQKSAEFVNRVGPFFEELGKAREYFINGNRPGERARVEEKSAQMQQTNQRIAESINSRWRDPLWNRINELRAEEGKVGQQIGELDAQGKYLETLELRQQRVKICEEKASCLKGLDAHVYAIQIAELQTFWAELKDIEASKVKLEADSLWAQGAFDRATNLYFKVQDLATEAIANRGKSFVGLNAIGNPVFADATYHAAQRCYENLYLSISEQLLQLYFEDLDDGLLSSKAEKKIEQIFTRYRSAGFHLESEGCDPRIFYRYHIDAWNVKARFYELLSRLSLGLAQGQEDLVLAASNYADAYGYALQAIRFREEQAAHSDHIGIHDHAKNCRAHQGESKARIAQIFDKRHSIQGAPGALLRQKLSAVAKETLADPGFTASMPAEQVNWAKECEHLFPGEAFYALGGEIRNAANVFLSDGDIGQAAKRLSESHYQYIEAAKEFELSARSLEGYNPGGAKSHREFKDHVFGITTEIRSQIINLFLELESQERAYDGLPYLDAITECMEHEAGYRDFIGEATRKHFCLNIKHNWAAKALELRLEGIFSLIDSDEGLSQVDQLDLLRSAKRYAVMALENRRAGISEFYLAGNLAPHDLTKHEGRIKPLEQYLSSIDGKIAVLEAQLSSLLDIDRIDSFYKQQSIVAENATDTALGFNDNVSVSSLSGQKGVALSNQVDCSEPRTPWAACVNQASKIHKGNRSLIEKTTPVAGYGELSGGSPLYVNQTYRFDLKAGQQCRLNGSSSAPENLRLLVKVYDKDSLSEGVTVQQPVYQESMVIPLKPCKSEWGGIDIGEMDLLWEKEYLSEGGHSYSRKGNLYLDYGLETFIGYTGNPYSGPGSLLDLLGGLFGGGSVSSYNDSELIIAHRASSSKYTFIIEIKGFLDGSNEEPITVVHGDTDEDLEPSFTSMYALDFSERLPWQLESLHKPSFEKHGKKPSEASSGHETGWYSPFQTSKPDAPNKLIAPRGTNLEAGYESLHSALHSSPSAELRKHSILDAFVEEMGRDPLALATYVQNEIALIQAPEAYSFGAGDIERSALGVFLEKQGSSWEQCALLVYLLRQAGYKALYVMPPSEGLEFSVEQLSQMFTTQLDGKLPFGSDSTRLKFPWVVFEDPETGQWVDLFPWIKNARIEEGLDLYPLMPEGYNNALSWVRRYLENDPEILKHIGSDGNDTAGVLFNRFVAEHLAKLGLSMSDVGAIITPVKSQFASWDEFPKPISALTWSNYLTTRYDLRDREDLFPKVSVAVSSMEDPSKRIETGDLKMCDVQNRRLYVHFTPESGDPNERNHRMHLELASYDAANPGNPGDFNCQNMGGAQEKSIVLGAFDQTAQIHIQYGKSVKGEDTFTIQKGVLAGICLNLGSVTQDMLEVLAQQLNEAGDNAKEKLSATAYLTGMAYYEKLSTMGAQLNRLHKVVPPPSFAAGLSKLSPDYRRGSPNVAHDGAFIGTPKLYYPQVDMHYSSQGGVYNDHLRADLEEDRTSVTKDLKILWIADGSANEHQIINEFFNQKHAISTVKLLQLAQKRHTEAGKRGTGFLVFTRKIFEQANGDPEAANKRFFEGQFDLNHIKHEGSGQWSILAENFSLKNDGRGFASDDNGASFYTVAFMTPGNVYSDDGNPGDPNHRPSYTGMGTLLLAPTQWSAMISSGTQTMNGGYGQRVQEHTFESYNMPNINADYNAGQGWSLDGVQSAADPISFDSGWGADYAREHILDSHWEFNVGPANTDASWSQQDSYFEPAPTFAQEHFDAQPSYADPFANINQNNPFEANEYQPFETADSGGYDSPSWQEYLDPIREWANSRNEEAASDWNSWDQGGHEEYVHVPHLESPYGQDYYDNNPHYEYEGGGEPYADYGYEPNYDYVDTPQYEAFDYDNFAQQYAENGYLAPEVHLGSMQDNAAVGDPINIATGTFYIDEVDISVPGPFELEIRRNYSSKNPLPGEYGFGWKRNIVSYLVLNQQEGNDTITAAETDGTVIVYRKLADKHRWVPLPEDNPELSNKAGGANPFHGYIDLVGVDNERVYTLHGADGSTREYHMKSFPVAASGVQRNRPYLHKWTDERGNFLNFAYGEHEKTEQGASKSDYGQITRIESNTGSFLVFKYNDKALVSEARSSDGRSVKYHYNKWSGDLEVVERPDNTVVKYTYQKQVREEDGKNVISSTHRIVREEKPEGRILENVYDDEGRVIEQRSTVGKKGALVRNASFEYVQQDGKPKEFTITRARDAFGQMTEYHIYKGFIYNVVDPMGGVFQQAWFVTRNTYLDPETGTIKDLPEGAPRGYRRSIMHEVDKRGLKTAYTYDELGNVTTMTIEGADLTGTGITQTSIHHAYIPGTTLLERTERTGEEGTVKSTVTTYDETYRRLPKTITEYVGEQEIARRTFEYGSVEGAHGLLMHETSSGRGASSATETRFEYNAQGFPIKKTNLLGESSIITEYQYNKRGQCSMLTEPSGATKHYKYDVMGRLLEQLDRDDRGNIIREEYFHYNQNGELIQVDGPEGNPLERTMLAYDKAGRMIYEAHAARTVALNAYGQLDIRELTGPTMIQNGAYTGLFEYNALGNLRVAYDPNGNRSEMTYDALNRLKTVTKAGLEESFEYEPGGHVTHMSDNTGREVFQEYTTTGLLKYRKNADGTEDTWSYDLEGRPVRESLAGVVWTIAYNDLKGTVTRHCEATGATETTTYDYRGNEIAYIDAKGAQFEKTYDALGRLLEEQGPEGLHNYYDYIPEENYTSQTNALNESVETYYDSLGRMTRQFVTNADGTIIRSIQKDYDATSASVTTTLFGEGEDPIIQKTIHDTRGNIIVTRESVNGVPAITYFEYDAKGNRIASHSPEGQTHRYEYDAFDRLVKEIRPDGSEITYTYDLAGNLTHRHMPGGLTWSAEYNTQGQRTSEVLTGGGRNTRAFGYTYENGLLKTKADPRGITFEYAYDAARRIEHIRAGEDTTSYAYDLQGNIRRIEQHSGEDHSVLEHSYNTLGLLEDEHVTLNGNLAQSWHQTWNAAGNRTALTLNNPPVNGEKGSNRTYKYDALGRMTMASNDATGKSTYTYAAHGLSIRRTPWITQAVEERKTQENGLVGQVNTYVKGQDVLFEHLTWRSDHKLASQRLQRKGNAKTQHTYHYNVLGQLEKDIYTYPGLGVTPTYTYGYDALGVLTNVAEQGNIDGNTHWDCNLDPLHRIAQETIDIDKDTKILLEGDTEGCVRQVHVSANGGNRIEADLEQLSNDTAHWKAYLSNLKIGESNRIKVTATNEEEIATDEVFNKLLEPYVVSSYDGLGNLTSRHNALTGESTTYSWDTWGRLVSVSEHSSDGTTKTWTYRYDALGRRLETQYEGEQGITIKSFYDPEFEYLELGLKVGATTVWKQYGPDSSGYYGELNGIGGLEGVINGKTGDSTGTINDITGNIVAYTDQGETHFLAGNIDNYGRLTGDYWLDEESSELIAQTTFWVLKNSRFRGRRVEGNGLSNFGTRYYNTETASFLSPDPYGHNGSLDLYSYASADPVNYVDPDGRLSQPVNQPLGNEAPQQSFYQKASSFVTSKLDHIQTGLDLIGMTPGIGNVADIANAAISGARGDWSGMAMNMAAAMPVVGIGVTASKLGVKAGTEVAQSAGKINNGGLNLFRWGESTTSSSSGWKAGDRMLNLPNKGTPKANWKQNSGALRREMRSKEPIFDSYRDPTTGLQIPSGTTPTSGGRFLNAERLLLESRGWQYNPATGAYHPLGG